MEEKYIIEISSNLFIYIYTEKSVAFPDPVMCIGAMPLQNLFKQYDTYDFPNLKLIE